MLEGFGDSGRDRLRMRNMHCGHVVRYVARWWCEWVTQRRKTCYTDCWWVYTGFFVSSCGSPQSE